MRNRRARAAPVAAIVLASAASADSLPVSLSLSSENSRPRSAPLRWTTTSTAIDLLSQQSGAFQRSSVAYWGTADGMLEFPPDEPRRTEVAACSASDGGFVADTVPGGGAITPQCVHGGYLLGRGANMKLYRSADGSNWEWLSDQPLSYIFSVSGGGLVGTSFSPDNYLQIWRSADDGATWMQATWADDGSPCVWPNQNAYLGSWGFHQAASGTIVAVEYETPSGGHFIYRSDDDGRTWRIVHDEYATTEISHFHALTKHEGLGRWIAATGDGHDVHHFVASDDDGLTWYDYTAPHEVFAQPMALLDYGDPERLLFGSDLHWQVGELNVSDGPNRAHIRSVLTNWDSSPAKGFCFVLFQHDDVYYACQIDLMLNNRQPVISVSRDRVHWAVYHRFTQAENGAFRYCGFINGKLHLAIQRDGWLAHFAMSPARVDVRSGLVLSPAGENLLATAAASSGESSDGWMNASEELPVGSGNRGFLESSTAMAHHGAGSIHYSRSDGGNMVLYSASGTAPADAVIRARAWVRGDCAACWLRLRYNFADAPVAAFFSPNPDGWQEIVSAPMFLSPPFHELRAAITCTSRSGSVLDVYVDSLQIEAGPTTPWQMGGTPRATELRSAQMPAGPWTHLFSIQPEGFSDYLYEEERLDLCSYVTPGGDVATLSFDPLDRRFKIRATPIGQPTQILETPPQRFQRQAQIRFAVRNTASGMRLAIVNGQPLEHATPPPVVPFAMSDVTWQSGDASGEFLMPAIWIDSAIIPAGLSDAELSQAISQPSLPADWQPSTVTIERRPPGGSWQSVASVPAQHGEFTDHTGLPGETWEYRAVALNGTWRAAPSDPVSVTYARVGDINGDDAVDLNDLASILATFGLLQENPGFQIDADFTGDGTIDLSDLTLLLTAFGW